MNRQKARQQTTNSAPTTRRAFLKYGLYGLTAGLSGAAIGGCAGRPPRRPNVVFVLIDTLRPDYLGFYGFATETASFLGKLATDSVVFDRAFATSSWTAPSTASLFTSVYPHQLGVVEGFYCHKARMEAFRKTGNAEIPLNRIPGDVPTLPEIFKSLGYTTYALAANINIGYEIGFDRGFDKFERQNDAPAPVFYDWVEKLHGELEKSKPFLLYLHLNDVHSPYHARPPYYQQHQDPKADSRAKYISEIGYADEHIGRIWDKLLTDDNTVFVAASDHGEEFWDHGSNGHRPRLYRELTQVLLMFHAPWFSSRRVTANVSLLDVLPTLIDLAGGQPTEELEGISLAPILRADRQADGLIEKLRARTLFAHRVADTPEWQLWSAIRGHWNLIEWPDGRSDLFDHRLDFAEKSNVFSAYPQVGRELLGELSEFKKHRRRAETESTQVQLDENMLETLKSLGYVE